MLAIGVWVALAAPASAHPTVLVGLPGGHWADYLDPVAYADEHCSGPRLATGPLGLHLPPLDGAASGDRAVYLSGSVIGERTHSFEICGLLSPVETTRAPSMVASQWRDGRGRVLAPGHEAVLSNLRSSVPASLNNVVLHGDYVEASGDAGKVFIQLAAHGQQSTGGFHYFVVGLEMVAS